MKKHNLDILSFDEVDSTNNQAQRLLATRDKYPFWIIADEQTAGRGRKNRYWVSQKGNFMGTFVLKKSFQKKYTPQLSFVTSLALQETIKQYDINNKSNVFIKWPNDILINDAKCAGILIENLNSETSQEFIAIGIGVNITTHPDNSMFRATSLKREFDFEIDRDEFLDNLTYNLLSKIRNWDNGNNILNILKIWKKYAYKLNKKISMLLSSGDRVNGIFQDLDSQGGLILISEGKKRVFYAAEIIEEIKID